MSTPTGYRRIVCLTEETTETIYLLGEQDRIVGISGYTVRPPQARTEKPKVSAFTSAKIEKILALKPDLVLGFSDLQASIASDLVSAGLEVHFFNQRSIEEILRMIEIVGAFVGAPEKALLLAEGYRRRLDKTRAVAAKLVRAPIVYFEEWGDPMISAIRWVSELIEIAGGRDCFPELSHSHGAKGRVIADAAEIVRRKPDIVIGSWCGRRFPVDLVKARAGWDAIPAVIHGCVHEIKSSEILQPGPAALTTGLDRISSIIQGWADIFDA
ncbi:MAG: cobalamin-binding protein [Rhizomicrobium sp.]